MARGKQEAEAVPAGLTPEVLDQQVAGVHNPGHVQTVWRRVQKANAERMLYARGLSTRESRSSLKERYQVPVSPDAVSTITREMLAEFETWRPRCCNFTIWSSPSARRE